MFKAFILPQRNAASSKLPPDEFLNIFHPASGWLFEMPCYIRKTMQNRFRLKVFNVFLVLNFDWNTGFLFADSKALTLRLLTLVNDLFQRIFRRDLKSWRESGYLSNNLWLGKIQWLLKVRLYRCSKFQSTIYVLKQANIFCLIREFVLLWNAWINNLRFSEWLLI